MAFMAIMRPGRFTGSVHGSPEAAKISELKKPCAGNRQSFMAIKSSGKKEALDDWIIGALLFKVSFRKMRLWKMRL